MPKRSESRRKEPEPNAQWLAFWSQVLEIARELAALRERREAEGRPR